MEEQNGQRGPARWGGRIGDWVEERSGGTEIAIQRIRRAASPMMRGRGEMWLRRWPYISVGVAFLTGLVIGLRTKE